MAEYRVKKLQVDAPPEGDLLPRWRYDALCENTGTHSTVSTSFLSDDENPMNDVDVCNTILGLLGDGATIEGGCPS